MEKVFKLNNKIYALLTDFEMNGFTMLELCEKYQASGMSTSNNKQDRQFLYRQLFALESKGLLVKQGTSYSREIRYSKTTLFEESKIIPKNPDLSVINNNTHKLQLPPLLDLKKTLMQYQLKFVSTLGESEEYQKMLEEFPSMSPHIKDHYYQTRESSTKYLGKINALKKIIQGYPR